MKAILVTHDAQVQRSFQQALLVRGHECSVYPSVEKAAAALHAQPVDLLLLDTETVDQLGAIIAETQNRQTQNSPFYCVLLREHWVEKIENVLKSGADDAVCISDIKAFQTRLPIIEHWVEQRQNSLETPVPNSASDWLSLLGNAQDFIAVIDEKGTILFINHTFPQMTAQQVQGNNVFDYIEPKYHERVKRCYARVFKTGEADHYEVPGMGPEDTTAWYSTCVSPIQREGSVVALTLIATDITAHRITEAALRESEQQYRSLVELSPDAIVVHSEGKIVYINPAGVKLFKASQADEIIGRPFLDFIPQNDRVSVLTQIRQSEYAGKPLEKVEERLLRLDGKILDIEVSSISTPYQGKPARQAILRDITKRKRAEAALRQSEAKYRGLFDNTPIGLYQSSGKNYFLTVNPAFVAMLGYEDEREVLALNIEQDIYYDPTERARRIEAFEKTKDRNISREIRLKRKDGTPMTVYNHGHAVLDEEGKLRYFEGFVIDMTEQKRAERALRESEEALRSKEEQYRSLVELSPDAIVVHSEGKFVYINSAGLKLYGADKPEDIIGRSISDIIPKGEREIRMERVLQTYQGKSFELVQGKVQRLDGRIVDVELSVTPIRYLGKTASQAIVRDITDRKRTELELNKLNQLSQNMVSMVAHELRTPLTSIQGYASFLRDGDAGLVKREQEEILDIIIRNSQRLSTLVETFLDLEKMEAGMFYMDQRYFLLEHLLSEVESTFRISVQHNGVRLRTEFENELLIYGDKNQLFRVFSNLISNAIKFTDKGVIEVRARKIEDQVVVEVIDEGAGIAEEDLPYIFERFYQSQHKRSSQYSEGSGLGLAIAKVIVSEHGGTIQVQSKLNEGSIFTVMLPLAPDRRQIPR